MAKKRDLYQILGVDRKASTEEIKKAYRKLAREHHPDVNPGDPEAEERFKDISFAKEVLLSDEKRKLYDEFGEEGLASGFDASEARAYRDWARRAQQSPGYESFGGGSAGDVDLEDLLSQLFGGRRGGGSGADFGGGMGGDMGGGFGGGTYTFRGQPGRGPRRGADFESSLEVDFVDAIQGNEVQMRIEGREPLRVRIPRGAKDGTRIRLKGQGQPAGPGAEPGDLYVRLRVRPHPFFRRDGDDLHLDVPVTIPELVRGAEIPIPTPDGTTLVKVPAHSQNGRTLRLPGKGVAKRAGKGGEAAERGHLFLHLQAVLPTGEDAALDEAVERLERCYGDGDPRAGLRWEAGR